MNFQNRIFLYYLHRHPIWPSCTKTYWNTKTHWCWVGFICRYPRWRCS